MLNIHQFTGCFQQ